MKVLLVDLKKNIFSPKFVLSVTLLCLLCLLADAPLISAREPFSILDEIIKSRSSVWLNKGTEYAAPSIFFRFDNSLWYSIILPVIAAFSIIYNFSDEWFSDNYIMTLSRCGYNTYSFSKFFSAFFTGILTAFFGFIFFGSVIALIFPSLNEFTGKNELYLSGSYMNQYEAIIAKILNNIFLCGFYAVFSLFLCLIIRDKFFALSLLIVINYFSMKLETEFVNGEFFYIGNHKKLRILFPNCQKDIYYLLPDYFEVSFYWYIPLVIFATVVITIISSFIIKERYKNAS